MADALRRRVRSQAASVNADALRPFATRHPNPNTV